MRDTDAQILEVAVTILEVTSDLHASRLEAHVAGRAGLILHTYMTMRLTTAASMVIAHTIDGVGVVEEILRPLLDVFGDVTDWWGHLDEDLRSRLNELERRALELIATGLPGDSAF